MEDSDICSSLNAEPADKSVAKSESLKNFLYECSEELYKNNIELMKFSSESSADFYVKYTLNSPIVNQLDLFESLEKLQGNIVCEKSKEPTSNKDYIFLLIGVGSMFASVTVLTLIVLYHQKVI